MINSREMKYEQDNPVPNGTECTALYDAVPEYNIDLDFKKGEIITIVEPCNVLFFYIGKNSEGKEGVIPINYFNFKAKKQSAEKDAGASANAPPKVAPRPKSRPPGSPVSLTPPVAQRSGAKTMPRLIGASQPIAKWSDIDRRPPCPLPQEALNPISPLDATDKFKKTSGWFTPGVQQVIANKSTYSLQVLQRVRTGIYVFAHKSNYKLTFCGGSQDLLNELTSMLEHLYKKNDLFLSPLEHKLRQHPSAEEWIVKLKVSVMPDDLCLELAKSIITNDSLYPNGLNSELELYTKNDWARFTEWVANK